MIAICPNPFRDIDYHISLDIKNRLEAAGFKTCICPLFIDGESSTLPGNIPVEKLSDVGAKCEAVIVVGGDGTVLDAARQLHNIPVPILGVNLGTKGFMAALEPGELDHLVPALRGGMRLSRRMKLDVSVIRGGKCILEDSALNDAVMHGYGDCIKMTVFCNGDRITSFSGDGIILSTPTGSTGYSLSCGGPIISPNAAMTVMTPIAPHTLNTRSLIFPEDDVITVELGEGRRQIQENGLASFDGDVEVPMSTGDRIVIKKASVSVKILKLNHLSFVEVLRQKMSNN